MKILTWICGILAVLMVIFAGIMGLFGVVPFLTVTKGINFIHFANTLILFMIAFILCDKKKE
ncbi:MAG TPA: hypothetical protein ENL10_02955 [Candidatus Cloacimonetes bacterium]|nr:hypothetical protein [Candidatus Cloacimonadota bacterium]HHE40442.1 hypothetical protein [Candidatus Cloacimonadota bacterium]